jgi:signal peptidase I
MAKKKTSYSKLAPTAPSAAPRATPGASWVHSWFSASAIRETIESFAVAFILAFLFRGFEAEAFMIPTGSMAPTLMGQHKDLKCPECGYRYSAGASSEDEELAQQRGRVGGGQDVVAVTCPLCRFTTNVDPRTAAGREHPSYGGDRVLVSKFAYEFAEPRRWDVFVFKYPGEAQTNYIKRLVGLPNEIVRLWHGDLYVKAEGENEFHLERRRPATLQAMAQMVYDNDYVVDSMTQAGWPLRWQSWPAAEPTAQGGWKSSDGSRSYAVDAQAGDPLWLRYQHFAPSIDEWAMLENGSLPKDYQPRPRLITDFYAYDSSVLRGQPLEQPQMLGMHWVGDLLLECQCDVRAAQGTALFDLVKGGRHFRCAIDCQTGQARLSIDSLPDYRPQASTAVRGPGSHQVAFANIDEQLLLWIDGAAVAFDTPTTYEPLANDRPRSDAHDPLDLAPAGVGAQNASLGVSHLRLRRDIYYIAAREGPVADYAPPLARLLHMNYRELLKFWSTPELWAPPGQSSPFDERREAIFPLKADQFFALGDNSPLSQDARLWEHEKFVNRELLVGKALLVFWPHSFNRVPGTPIPFPFFPNFARMRLIR